MNVAAGLFDIGRIRVQAVGKVPVIGTEFGRKFAVAAPYVDDQATGRSRAAENVEPRLGLTGGESRDDSTVQNQ